MAPQFSDLTSPQTESDDDLAAVDSIVSQAIDSATLEQIAELNSSSLPARLETRFQRLRSFPIESIDANSQLMSRNGDETEITTSSKNLNGKKSPNLETRFQSLKSFPVATNSQLRTTRKSKADEAEIISSKNPNGEKSQEQKPSSLPSVRPYREHSPSPPRTVCCFGCSSSSRRTPKKKNDEILTDFSTFSLKEQQRRLKKALKEEKKVSREAEKVVEWVKQASARMDVSAIDELLSEDDEKYHK